MSRIEHLKDKGLTQWKYTNSQKNYCIVPDYSGGKVVIFKETLATNWKKYFKANVQAGLEGTGYIIHRYKRGDGIKKTVVGKTYANYLNANDKKYYGMTGKQFYNFTENDNGYENALFFKTNQKEAA